MDAVSAFTQGKLDDLVLVELPLGYSELNPGQAENSKGKVLALKKALYGLKQLAIIWQKQVQKVLSGLGFT